MTQESEKLSALYEIKRSIAENKNLIDKNHYEAYLRYEVWQANLAKLKNIRALCKEKFIQEQAMPNSMTTVSRLRELESEYLVSCNNYEEYDISFRPTLISRLPD